MRKVVGFEATSASRSSRGNPKPSSDSSGETAAKTMLPTRNFTESRTIAS